MIMNMLIIKKNGILACMTSFLNRMQASDISNVCNQVLEEIALRVANIHPPAGVSQGFTEEAFLR